ncbi:MAG: cytochrome c-type biogenesis protein CcmH [Hyphomicrobiales bacterium]|nr:cytochrome c-type biogenesis protein CcmH [Hyphomicrobiales bacterium]
MRSRERPWRRWAAALLLVLATLTNAAAVQPDEILSDPAQEARARTLSRELRCMVCQNQSIDDSDAPLARDLRLLVRERIVAGDSDRQVLDFMVQRYGEFVLLRPRLSLRNALLWLAAPLLLIVGALVLIVLARRRAAGDPRGAIEGGAEDGALSAEERRRLAALVEREGR